MRAKARALESCYAHNSKTLDKFKYKNKNICNFIFKNVEAV